MTGNTNSTVPVLPGGRRAAVGMIALGCARNLVDAEVMLGSLAEAGYVITPDPEAADVILVNTCSFIDIARDESRAEIEEALCRKRGGRCRAVVVTGCWPQTSADALAAEFPEVDAFVGVGEVERIARVVGRLLSEGEKSAGPLVSVSLPDYLYDHQSPRLLATPPWLAYLKIAEGCDHRCSFCAIPHIRGRYRSRELESVVAEAARWAGEGVREFIVIAQDTTRYGVDRYGKRMLVPLLRRLCEIESVCWVRMMYGHPESITDELIDLLAEGGKVCRYLDIPFQHSHPAVLRRMGRAGDGDAHLRMIERIRERVPEVTIRTSLLVGHPGEGEDEFRQLLEFLEAAQFDRAGVFAYSREAGTPSGEADDQVPREIAEQRRGLVMEAQQRISSQRSRAWIGREIDVLLDDTSGGTWSGRSERDAPEVDGLVYVQAGNRARAGARPGDFVRVRITESGPYDLAGRVYPARLRR